MNRVIRTALIILLVSQLNSYVFASEWPVIEKIPGSHVVWVGDDMVQNGVPLRVKQFQSDMGIEDVIEFYRGQWEPVSKFAPVVNEIGEWKVIGRQEGDFYLTVQVKQGKDTASEGFMSVSKLPVFSGVDTGFDLPLLEGSVVLSRTGSHDIGREGETSVVTNDYSVQSNISYYEAKMQEDGWKATRSETRYVEGRPGKFIYFQKSKESCTILISEGERGESVLVFNRMKKG